MPELVDIEAARQYIALLEQAEATAEKLYTKIADLERLVCELREREQRMRETSMQWMIRSMSMEQVLRKNGVCWYA